MDKEIISGGLSLLNPKSDLLQKVEDEVRKEEREVADKKVHEANFSATLDRLSVLNNEDQTSSLSDEDPMFLMDEDFSELEGVTVCGDGLDDEIPPSSVSTDSSLTSDLSSSPFSRGGRF